MKTLRIASLLAIAAAAASSAFAGPGLQYWNALRIRTQKEAQAIKPGDTMALVCGACKTVNLAEYKSDWPNPKGTPRWIEIGTKHTCENCSGEITIVKGKTTDTMQHNCSKCDDDAAFCCAGSVPSRQR
jgi:hypothetical protein